MACGSSATFDSNSAAACSKPTPSPRALARRSESGSVATALHIGTGPAGARRAGDYISSALS